MEVRPAVLALLVAVPAAAGCIGSFETRTGPAPDGPAETADPVDLAPPVDELVERLDRAVRRNGTATVPVQPVETTLGFSGTLGEVEEVEVDPAPSLLVTNATWAEVDGSRVELPWFRAYEGHVAGAEGQPFRLVASEGWARGVVVWGDRRAHIRVGLDGNLPAPNATSEGRTAWGLDQPERPTGHRVDREAEPCGLLNPGPIEPVLQDGAFDGEEIRSEVILDGDAQLRERFGREAFPLMVAMIHEADAIYDHEVGVRLGIAGVHLHTPSRDIGSSTLESVASYWNERNVNRDLVHALIWRDTSFAGAYCGAGYPSAAYSYTPVPWAEDGAVAHVNAIAHEIGHLFNAKHRHANHVEAGAGEMATIMIQGYTPGVRPVYSTLSKSHIRGWAEAHVAG